MRWKAIGSNRTVQKLLSPFAFTYFVMGQLLNGAANTIHQTCSGICPRIVKDYGNSTFSVPKQKEYRQIIRGEILDETISVPCTVKIPSIFAMRAFTPQPTYCCEPTLHSPGDAYQHPDTAPSRLGQTNTNPRCRQSAYHSDLQVPTWKKGPILQNPHSQGIRSSS